MVTTLLNSSSSSRNDRILRTCARVVGEIG